MKKHSSSRNVFAALLFFALVITGGVALRATGNLENPFAALSTGAPAGERGAPPARTAEDSAPAERAAMGGGGESAALNWSQFGHVLYNAWFLCAATAFVVLISGPLSFVTRRLRQSQTRPTMAQHPASG